MRVALFVPCYNVEATVVQVLEKIPADILEKLEFVLLVDNVSQDNTRTVLTDYLRAKKNPKLRLFFNQQNYSLGGSTIVAFRAAIADNLDFLICLHSDGQADPLDLRNFFPLLQTEDFVLGSRMLQGSQTADYSLLRKFGNLFFAYLQQIILRQKVYDIGAFIAFNLKTIASLPYAKIKPDMAYQPNLILYAATLKHLTFREFPIYWGPVTSSHVNIWRYGMEHLVRLFRIFFRIFPLLDRTASDYQSVEWKLEK
jgi:dolichol-phosphate mannosyltransferase